MGKELLTLQNVSKYYNSGQTVVMGLTGVNLTFSAGEFVAITGESGSGKSTLAHILGGILPYESGELLVEGKPTSHYDSGDWERYRRDNISFIAQNYGILPGSTVLSNVISALRLSGMEEEQALGEAEVILRKLELWDMRKKRAAKLSSGQKQRLSIARALAKPAPILLADEPTGNLDRENSEKVISLLAEAAKDRLVILITHEFEEARDCATRHVVLQDGRVTMDAQLRPGASSGEAQPPVRPAGKRKDLSAYVARVQMSARPVWCAIMALFFALTAFAVFAFLGTFIVNLDDTHTRYYDNSAFRNGDSTRVVVQREDGERLTAEDYDALLALEQVDRLERYGYLADMTYYYREDVDLEYTYYTEMDSWGNPLAVSRSVGLTGAGLFLQAEPLLPEGEGFLTAGRLPQTAYEVVAAGDESLIGQRFPLYIRDTKNWNNGAWLEFTVEITGVTDKGYGLYCSDELAQILTDYVTKAHIQMSLTRSAGMVLLPYDYESLLDRRLLEPKDGVNYKLPDYYYTEPVLQWGEDAAYEEVIGPDGQIGYVRRTAFTVEFLANWQVVNSSAFTRFIPMGGELGTVQIWGAFAEGDHPSTYINAITVPRDFFDLQVVEDHGGQASLYATDYAYLSRLLEDVRELGYIATAPYLSGTTTQNEELAAQRMQTLEVCLLALAAVVLLQILVLRAMFSVEMEGYTLLADLGLGCKAAKRSALWQVLAFTLLGEVLAALALLLCGGLGVERIVRVLRYLPAPYMILTWAVHMALSLIAALWITSAIRRQVYPITGTRPDLDMSDGEEGEA